MASGQNRGLLYISTHTWAYCLSCPRIGGPIPQLIYCSIYSITTVVTGVPARTKYSIYGPLYCSIHRVATVATGVPAGKKYSIYGPNYCSIYCVATVATGVPGGTKYSIYGPIYCSIYCVATIATEVLACTKYSIYGSIYCSIYGVATVATGVPAGTKYSIYGPIYCSIYRVATIATGVPAGTKYSIYGPNYCSIYRVATVATGVPGPGMRIAKLNTVEKQRGEAIHTSLNCVAMNTTILRTMKMVSMLPTSKFNTSSPFLGENENVLKYGAELHPYSAAALHPAAGPIGPVLKTPQLSSPTSLVSSSSARGLIKDAGWLIPRTRLCIRKTNNHHGFRATCNFSIFMLSKNRGKSCLSLPWREVGLECGAGFYVPDPSQYERQQGSILVGCWFNFLRRSVALQLLFIRDLVHLVLVIYVGHSAG
ncbi:hypothetical protein DFH08DRAFT_1036251 [Mycena albidolilacea]|uniref:Uncharacterized protein n=1 Tax=Mycena albidolilacea TaxID=1033008 RepID=A0AAD6ZDL5_9AGAR|nr:hypothetical protein DFH08DRAFT_1036251 [Mycena albidolilacea]